MKSQMNKKDKKSKKDQKSQKIRNSAPQRPRRVTRSSVMAEPAEGKANEPVTTPNSTKGKDHSGTEEHTTASPVTNMETNTNSSSSETSRSDPEASSSDYSEDEAHAAQESLRVTAATPAPEEEEEIPEGHNRGIKRRRKENDDGRPMSAETPSKEQRNTPPSKYSTKRLEEIMEVRRNEIRCPNGKCEIEGRLVWNGWGGSGRLIKCMACNKKTSATKLLEHVQVQFGTAEDKTAKTKEKPIELPVSPPSTTQEWRMLRAQMENIIKTNKDMAAQMAEAKQQLYRTTVQLNAIAPREAPSLPNRKKSSQRDRETTPRPPTTQNPFRIGSTLSHTANPYAQQPTAPHPFGQIPLDTLQNKQPPKRSYAEIAKLRKPKLDTFPEPIRERMSAGRAAMASFVRTPPKRHLQPEAIYFNNAQRGSLKKLREALRISLPGEAILHLDFIGGSLLEVMCHKPLVPKLISHIKFMSNGRMREINFDPLARTTISKDRQTTGKDLWARNTTNCAKRIGRILSGNPHPEVRAYFNTIHEKAREILKKLEDQQGEEEQGEDGWTKVTNSRRSPLPAPEPENRDGETQTANEN